MFGNETVHVVNITKKCCMCFALKPFSDGFSPALAPLSPDPFMNLILLPSDVTIDSLLNGASEEKKHPVDS